VLGAKLAAGVVRRIDAGTVQGRKQDAAQVTKAPKLKKENGVIDWTRPAAAVCNQVRAMQPWPTAYTWWHRQGQAPLRLIVNRARVGERLADETGQPGTILPPPSDLTRLRVMAGENTVVAVEELQPEGKRRMPAADFLRGRHPQPGDYLGPQA
jgi:methionyl-tRNA formyltransferase